MHESRFIVGIDLGTTNTAVFYIDTERHEKVIQPFRIPQVVAAGEIDERPLLPSFCYLPAPDELPENALKLPWPNTNNHCVGIFARDHGSNVPSRLISSAKSWLAHAGVDRSEPILPWGSKHAGSLKSPVEVSSLYLQHLRQSWNHKFRRTRDQAGSHCYLEDQQVVITIPASFDETAREFTIKAAKSAGYKNIILVEEPLSAFYAWLNKHEENWQNEIMPGEKVLVIDVGGGTTDFSLIEIDENHVMHRYAVGNHLLLGGDNIDIAIAHRLEQEWDSKLSGHDWAALSQLCRCAKETLLSSAKEKTNITLITKGSSVLKNTKTAVLSKTELMTMLNDGFYPLVDINRPISGIRSGIRRMGLPYADNPAITEHLLDFLRYAFQISRSGKTGDSEISEDAEHREFVFPDKILFNGGSMIAPQIRDRIVTAISQWHPDRKQPTILEGEDLSLAVAMGAAYHGWVRRGQGVKVRGGIARSYYLEAADETGGRNLICIISRDTDENIDVDVPGNFLLQTNEKVRFTLYSSATRLHDQPGKIIQSEEELSIVAPLSTVLQFGKTNKKTIDVSVHCELTEIGTLNICLQSLATDHRWPLQFDLRPISEAVPDERNREVAIILDIEKVESARRDLRTAFTAEPALLSGIVKALESRLEFGRSEWSIPVIRKLADTLIELRDCRTKSAAHEMRWYNLTGYCLRPGFGDPADSLRLREMWKLWFNGPVHSRNFQVAAEWWVFWRRIAAGFKGGQQQSVASTLVKQLCPKGTYRAKIREGDQAKKEMWRCLGALESIPIKTKLSLGRILLQRLNKLEAYEFWVLSRLGARRLFHAPVNLVIRPEDVHQWVHQLISNRPSAKSRKMHLFALSRLAASTGDRTLDLKSDLYQKTVDYLNEHQCPGRWLGNMKPTTINSFEDYEQVVADTLPVGLSLKK